MKTQFTSSGLEIVAFLAVFFAELQSAMLAVGFLIIADTFTGIWGAYREGGIHAITSRKLGRIITKLILYPLALIVAKVAQQYLAPAIPWTDVTAGIIAVVEVKSIFENMGALLGFNLWDRVKKAIWKDKPGKDD